LLELKFAGQYPISFCFLFETGEQDSACFVPTGMLRALKIKAMH
jgi:hypothetical protein